MIRKLTNDDMAMTAALFSMVISDLQKNGIDQWDEAYPSRAVLEADIAAGHAWGFMIDGEIAAYVAINGIADPAYEEVDWKFDHSRSAVVHRLAVNPQFRGRGIARRLMAFVEDCGRNQGYLAMRLDAFTGNPAALHLYDSLGYRRAGTVTFRKGSFVVFEKLL